MLGDPADTTRPRIRIADINSRSSDVTFGLKCAIFLFLLLYAAQGALAAFWAYRVLGTIGLGLMFAHAVELQHQALHYLGFRNRRLNAITSIVLGLPMLVSFAGYQASHLRHHRLLGTAQNKEFFDYGDQYGASCAASIWTWALRFLMLSHYRQFFANLWLTVRGREFPDEMPDVSKRMRRDHWVMLAAIALLGAISVVFYRPLILWLWLVPLCLVAAPAHALIEMPEHYRCDTRKTDVYANTRTIRSNPLLTWFTNGNNFHVEHHLMPGLPIERLPDLHEHIAAHIQNYNSTYVDFYRSLYRSSSKAGCNR
jgi:fatty acid desaturase